MKVSVARKSAAELFTELHKRMQSGEPITPADAKNRLEQAHAADKAEADKKTPTRSDVEVQDAEGFFTRKYAQPLGVSGGNRMAARDPGLAWTNPADADRSQQAPQETVQKTYERIISATPGEIPELNADEDIRAHKMMQDLHDSFAFCANQIDGWHPSTSKHFRSYETLVGQLVSKILTTQSGGTSTGTGGDFIPKTLSGNLITLFRQSLLLASNISHLTMPTSPWNLPLEGADVDPYLVAETTSDVMPLEANAIPTRTPATSKVTFTASGLKVRAYVSVESTEDSIINMIEYLRMKLTESIAQGVEDALVNGDNTSTHQDSGVTSANDHRKAWQGLRQLVNAEASFDRGNTALTAMAFVSIFNKMGKFSSPGSNVCVASNTGEAQLLGDSNLTTLDKLGSRATLLAGQVGAIFGRPLVISPKVQVNLNASGVQDEVTEDRSIALCYHRPSFAMGDRRNVTIESAKDIEMDRWVIVVTWRGDFQRLQAETSGNRNVGQLYNLSTSASF